MPIIPKQATISVEAAGEATLVPDVAVVTIAAFAQADRPALALTRCSERLGLVLGALRTLSSVTSVATRAIDVQQHVEPGPDQVPVRSYRASSSLTVRVEPPDSVGAVIAAAVDSASEGVVANGVRFEASDSGPARSEARRRAVEEALSIARELAEAAGVSLGPLRSLHEGIAMGRPPAVRAAKLARSAAGPPVEIGEDTVTVTVSAEFALGSGEAPGCS